MHLMVITVTIWILYSIAQTLVHAAPNRFASQDAFSRGNIVMGIAMLMATKQTPGLGGKHHQSTHDSFLSNVHSAHSPKDPAPYIVQGLWGKS